MTDRTDEVALLRDLVWTMCRRLGFDVDGDEHPPMSTPDLVGYGTRCAEKQRSDYDTALDAADERDRLLADQQQLRDAIEVISYELEGWAADRHGDEEPCDDVCRALAGFADRLASVSIPDTDKGEPR